MLLESKVVIITGAGQGIGRAVALRFAREGANVVVVGRTMQKVQETSKEVELAGRVSLAIQANVSVTDDIAHMVEKTMAKFGKIDILVNNAAVIIRKPLFEYSEQDWDETMNINLKSVFLCSKEVVPIMLKQGKGKIVNVASTAGQIGVRRGAYGASKAGVINLTASMALELAPYKINVNAVSPGAVETPMSAPVRSSPEMLKKVIGCLPYGRLAQPEEIASVILFLASDESDYLVGSTIIADGGLNTTYNCY